MNPVLNYVKSDGEAIFGFFDEFEFLALNFPCEIEFRGRFFPSAANAFFSARCDSEEDIEKLELASPYEAKEIGRTLPIPYNWIDTRDLIMEEVLEIKFKNEALARSLIKTGGKKLVNANHWNDTHWGTGEDGRGVNKMGEILEKIRAKKMPVSKPAFVPVPVPPQIDKVEEYQETQESGGFLKKFKRK